MKDFRTMAKQLLIRTAQRVFKQYTGLYLPASRAELSQVLALSGLLRLLLPMVGVTEARREQIVKVERRYTYLRYFV